MENYLILINKSFKFFRSKFLSATILIPLYLNHKIITAQEILKIIERYFKTYINYSKLNQQILMNSEY